MRINWVLVAPILLCSCESKTPPASGPGTISGNSQPQAVQKATKESGVIGLDQTQQQEGHVVVEPVRAKQVATTLPVPGRLTINEDQTWRVGAIASGRIEYIYARVGDSVDAGQVLGRLHSHEVHEARAGYEQAMTELQRAQAAEGYTKQRRDRALRLFELKAGSRQDVETAEADLQNAGAAIQKARSELEKERAHLNIFQLPVEEPVSNSAHHEEEDDIPILAPASGLVFERKATVGSVVNSGAELFTIINTGSLWMIAAADEVALSELRPGQRVQLQVRAYPDRQFSGRILKLGEKLDPDTRTLQIRILVPNPQGRLKPEMYATASLTQNGRRLATVVPDGAIQEINGVLLVFVRRSQNEFETRAIKAGQHTGGEVEILEGLNAGESVVVKGSFLLKSQLLKNTIRED